MLNIIEVLIISLLCRYSEALQCVDHNKNTVDWYVVYKIPQEQNENSLISQGAAYTYMTSNDSGDWKLSELSINDTNSIVGLTLEPLFTSATNNLHIVYNDALPDGSVNFKKGHTKGVVLGDSDGGIWLVHSVPHFPSVDQGSYFYPHSGFVYGQSFLCISMNIENLDKVGMQLQYNQPHIYSQNMPGNLKSLLPNLEDAINNMVVTSPPWYHLHVLKSTGGLMFFSFAKAQKFAKELYADWVSPALSVNLLVETWPNGRGRIPSQCGPHFQVKNIMSISLNAANFTFKATSDHSKWAVVFKDNPSAKWLCIGDINRAIPQRRRGGGTVCFSSSNVTEAYQNSIANVENC